MAGKRRPDVVTIDGDCYRIAFDYDPGMVEAVKQILGRTFDRDAKAWTVPRTPEAITGLRAFLSRFPEVEADDAVRADMDSVTDRARALADASKATDATIDIEGLTGELRPFQRAGVAYALEARRTFIADEMGLGKLQPVSEPVLTPTGWCPLWNIAPGDRVIGADGRPVEVLKVFPQGEVDIVRVTFSDGTWARCGLDHLWTVQHVRNGHRAPDRWETVTTRTLVERGIVDGAGNRNWRIPLTGPVQFDEPRVPAARPPVDPYILGVALGDGHWRKDGAVRITTASEILREIRAANITPHESDGIENGMVYIFGMGLEGHRSWEKFIPEEYLRGPDPEDRHALLQGLLDTDGSPMQDGGVEFCSTAEALVDGVVELVQSLGGVARNKKRRVTSYTYKGEKRKGRPSWRVNVKLPVTFPPFRFSEKVERYVPPTKYRPTRAIASIEPDGREQAVCIRVANEDGLYLTRSYIVTHNTVQALATVQAGDAFPALIVCPASLRLNWQREAGRWLPGRSTAVLTGTRATHLPRADIVIVNYDLLDAWQALLTKAPWQAVVFDESHYLKSAKAKRTKASKAIAKGRPFVLCLSGTPLVNRPAEFIAQLQILGRLQDLGGWRRYATRYCDGHKGRFGWDLSGAAHLDELNEALRRTCYVRRLKKDVLTELPPKVRSEVDIEITNAKEYARAANDVKQWLQDQVDKDQQFLDSIAHLSAEERASARADRRLEADVKARKAEELVRINALKRLSAEGKLEGATKWVADFLESGEKLVVFAHHKSVVSALAKVFKAPSITGDTSMEDRQAAVDRFQEDPECRVIVLNLQAGGVGLTLTAASNVAFVELGWTPGLHDQAEDRCHRIGQTDSVTAWYLLGQDTIDHDIYALIEQKRLIVNAAADGGIAVEEDSMLGEIIERIAA